MRSTLRLISVLLCLVLLWTGVAAAGPTADTSAQSLGETASTVPEEPLETVPVEPLETEALEPLETAAPEPLETAAPEPLETSPAEPLETAAAETEAAEPFDLAEPASEPAEPSDSSEPPLTEMTDEQIIAKFHLTTRWSRQALIFAVRNGILVGVSDDDLAPKSNTTHAQLAAMLMRILKPEKLADLSDYCDVRSGSWYYKDMQKAVALGLFPIVPGSKYLYPYIAVTREEVFVVLARMFGVHSDSRQAIYSFPDWADVSEWAATDLSAMIEAGYVSGSDGKLLPQESITREQLAQVLFEMLTKIGTSLDTTDFTGRMALASDTVPANTTIHGDLLLSANTYSIDLDHLTVTGRLIIQGNGLIHLYLTGCNIGELVIARDSEVHSDTSLPHITNFKTLRLFADAETIDNYGLLVLFEPHTVNTVNVMNQGRVSVGENALIQNLNILGDDVFINGKGTVQNLTVRGENLLNHVAVVQNTVNDPYNTAEDVTVTRLDNGVATVASPTVNLGLKLANMPEGWSECLVRWFVDGKEVQRDDRLLLQEGSVVSLSHNFKSFLDGNHDKVRFTVYFTCRGKGVLLYLGYVNVADAIRVMADGIRTQNVQGKLRYTSSLYSNMYLSGYIKDYSAGTQVTILQSREASYTKVRTPDGKVGWMKYANVAVIGDKYYITTDYPTPVKEYFVNKVKNWGSKTGYLIWVSLYTQRINIFQGSKGNWKLVRTGPIASGKNYCPTPVEDVEILYKTKQWSYAHYYCHHVSVFDEARGFHSRPTRYASDGGGIYDYAIGYPASSGCVRLMDADCIYIYDTCPTTTGVHIY